MESTTILSVKLTPNPSTVSAGKQIQDYLTQNNLVFQFPIAAGLYSCMREVEFKSVTNYNTPKCVKK